ncbi:LysM peptidoglycan-binding domain-containing protein [Pontibacter russatus]|uniref:LysM peptidoglycan-binding domain-containing protein n=1 Tax=Pontibacter russatus TaxID=2694929 RepID=UPI00137A225F|nr:LysM peptidoglycan-binding domain-containing protein [Pontibacter russatus]
MRKSISSLFALLLLPLLALAQLVTVPRNVYFADIHLTLTNGAQEEIQRKVDALHRNQTYFKMKVDLADAYFPVIERVFKEEGVPDDYKYLALQESGLIGDAISTSNAVGYWQFKREAASDFNLRMDHRVDERRHIIEASRGAAKYFLRSNNYYNNWLNSLLSYYLGYSGAKPYTRPSDNGTRRMEITEKVNPYILTFLAHKIAYEAFIGKSNPPALSLRELRAEPGQSLADIAMATQTDYAELEKYNKWLLGNTIPSDKDYYVMVPVRNGGSDAGLLASKDTTPLTKERPAATLVKAGRNGLTTIVARPGDTKDKLAAQAGLSTRRFLRYNDLRNFDKIEPGAVYYTEKKNMAADAEYHVVQPGETMQQISQHYGIRLNYLLFKNRMKRSEVPVPGRVLWLQKRRPAHTPIEVRDLGQKQPVAAAAAPSQSQPAVASAASTEEVKEQDKAPKESIFRRFINSFKRFKEDKPEPEEAEAGMEEEAAAATEVKKPAPAVRTKATAASKAAPATETETAEEQEEDGFMDPIVIEPVETDAATEAPPTQAPAAAPQKKQPELYPQSDTTSIFQEPAHATEETVDILLDSAATSPVAAEEDTTAEEEENWIIGTATDEDSTAEVKDIFVEPAATPSAKPKPAPAKPEKAAPAAAAKPAPKPTKHIVKQGETLYAISRMYAVTVNDLTAWNKLGNEPLRAGQELYIAEPLVQPTQAETAESAAAAQPAGNSAFHTVAAGETLYQISKAYHVSLEELREWNELSDNSIRLGQELRVQAPARAAAPEETDADTETSAVPASGYHTVASGESLYQISRQYGVTIKDIMEWNNKRDFSVSIGEKLRIRKK